LGGRRQLISDPNTGPFTGEMLCTADILGHECGHAIIDSIGSNLYEGESGAINESFADILGTCFEKYLNIAFDASNFDWDIGEIAFVPYLRSMSNPKSMNLPAFYKGSFWADTSDIENDNGGVHTNSSVINYLFYLCVNGSSGDQINDFSTSYNITQPLFDIFVLLKLIYHSYSEAFYLEIFSKINFESNMSQFVSALYHNIKYIMNKQNLQETFRQVAEAVAIKLLNYIVFAKPIETSLLILPRQITTFKKVYLPTRNINLLQFSTKALTNRYIPLKFSNEISI
jgi:hypothetical protein